MAKNKDKRYKSTRELLGELVAWIIIGLGVSVLFQASYGFLRADMSDATVAGMRASMWAMGSIFILMGGMFAMTNQWAHTRDKKFFPVLHRMNGTFAVVVIFGYGMIMMSSSIFQHGLDYNPTWLVLNLLIVFVLLMFGISQVSSTVKVNHDKVEKVNTVEIDKVEQPKERITEKEALNIIKNYADSKPTSTEDELKIW